VTSLLDIYDRIAPHLAAIQDVFVKGEVKVTLIVRNTKRHDADVVLGDDDEALAAQCLAEMGKRKAQIVNGKLVS
jgi:hypothetical protein